jgi:hypothetical protein
MLILLTWVILGGAMKLNEYLICSTQRKGEYTPTRENGLLMYEDRSRSRLWILLGHLEWLNRMVAPPWLDQDLGYINLPSRSLLPWINVSSVNGC